MKQKIGHENERRRGRRGNDEWKEKTLGVKVGNGMQREAFRRQQKYERM